MISAPTHLLASCLDNFAGPAMRKHAAKPCRKGASACQVCAADLDEASAYCRRKRICNDCMRAPEVVTPGGHLRFCWQHGALEELTCFDGLKRTCRDRLMRRKQSNSLATGTGAHAAAPEPLLLGHESASDSASVWPAEPAHSRHGSPVPSASLASVWQGISHVPQGTSYAPSRLREARSSSTPSSWALCDPDSIARDILATGLEPQTPGLSACPSDASDAGDLELLLECELLAAGMQAAHPGLAAHGQLAAAVMKSATPAGERSAASAGTGMAWPHHALAEASSVLLSSGLSADVEQVARLAELQATCAQLQAQVAMLRSRLLLA